MERIELVAIDLDGTLLEADHTIRPETRRALAEARRRGIHVIIATGRMYRSIRPYLQELDLLAPVITYNGAWVVEHPAGTTAAHDPVPLDVARQVAGFCRERELYLQLYVDDRLYVPAENEKSRLYEEISGVKGIPLGRDIYSPWQAPTKMLILEEEERMHALMASLRAKVGTRANLTTSYPFFLEVNAPEVSKGRALTLVAERLGVPMARTMGIGDSHNDLSLLDTAGFAVAVANAREGLRTIADYVTREERGLGVAEALERFVL